MKVARSIAELRREVAAWRARGERVGLVRRWAGSMPDIWRWSPAARDENRAGRRIAVRQPEAVRAVGGFYRLSARRGSRFRRVREGGVDLVFTPPVEDMYPPGFATSVRVGGIGDDLEARSVRGISRGSRQSSASYCCNACRTLLISAKRITSNCRSCGGWRATSISRCGSRGYRPCARRTVSRCRRAMSICRPRNAARRPCCTASCGRSRRDHGAPGR